MGPWLYQRGTAGCFASACREKSKTTGPLPGGLSAVPIPDATEHGDLRATKCSTKKSTGCQNDIRTAVVLRYLEGLIPQTKRRTRLGHPPGTVLSRLAWAKAIYEPG